MPSNKELVASASDLGAKLGVEVNTDGLNNEKLSALVKDLQAQRDKAAEDKATKDEAERQRKAGIQAVKKVIDDVTAQDKLATEMAGYMVAEGHTVQCALGELRPGKRLRGGAMTKEAFDTFKESGAVVKMAKSKV